MLDRLEALDLGLAMVMAMEDTAAEATAAQRWQLSQGLKSNDQFLPDYSRVSVTKFGKPDGPIKLFDTGAFYRGIFLDVRGDSFVLESADSKSEMLQTRYTEDIFGLGTQAQQQYILALEPVFFKAVYADLL